MKKLLTLFTFIFLVTSFTRVQFAAGDCSVAAADGSGCASDNQCAALHSGDTTWQCFQNTSGPQGCHCQRNSVIVPQPGGNGGTSSGTDPFGLITNPFATGPLASGGTNNPLINVLSIVIRLIFIISGIYAFIKILLAGLKFISSGGDAKAIESAWSSIWQSLLGLVIIVSSFIIAALIGQILYGDPLAILQPQVFIPN